MLRIQNVTKLAVPTIVAVHRILVGRFFYLLLLYCVYIITSQVQLLRQVVPNQVDFQ